MTKQEIDLILTGENRNRIKHQERLGEHHITKQGYTVEIVEYNGSLNCNIKFLTDRGNILYNIENHRVKKGTVVNPYHPNKYNGFMGDGDYQSSYNNKHSIAYKVWSDMLKRVYSEKYHTIKPTYKDINLCEEWHNFQNFAKWHEDNYNPEMMQGWHLDKDIICPDCKIYSPETCSFLPSEINAIFSSSKSYRGNLPIGVSKKRGHYEANFRNKFLGYSKNDINYLFNLYKMAREDYTKEIAEKYKDIIKPRVYNALINYQVEITD